MPEQGYWATDLAGSDDRTLRTTDPGGAAHRPPRLPRDPGRDTALLSYPLGDRARTCGRSARVRTPTADGVIQEVNGAGAEIWRWDTQRSLRTELVDVPASTSSTPTGLVRAFERGTCSTSTRSTACRDGDYVVSARHLDAVFRVDRSSRQRRLDARRAAVGSPGSSSRSSVIPYGGPKRPHDARMVGDVLTVFDNQAGMPGRQSRAVAYRHRRGGPRPATMLWEFRNSGAEHRRPTLGQRAAGGRRFVLVNWGRRPPADHRGAGAERHPPDVDHAPRGQLVVPHRQVPARATSTSSTCEQPPAAPDHPALTYTMCQTHRVRPSLLDGNDQPSQYQAQPYCSGSPQLTESRGSRVWRSENFI